MFKQNKAFTLIELLVVIAIIGILASVLLVSLNTARDRARIAAAKSQLSSMRAEAELLYDEVGSYVVGGTSPVPTDVCDEVPSGTTLSDASVAPGRLYKAAYDDADKAGGNTTGHDCNVATSGNAWAASVSLDAGNTWFCVDSTGVAKEEPAALGSATVCS